MVKYSLGTGLKYLCQTSQNDPYLYKGSGIRWNHHIKKHKSWIVTWIIDSFDTKEELKKAGLYYSQLWDIVNSNKWANLVCEQGDGGDMSNLLAYKKGIKSRKNMSGENSPRYNQTHTDEAKKKMSKSRKGKRPKNFSQWSKSFKNKRYIHHLDLKIEKRVNESELCNYLSINWKMGRLKIYKCENCGKISDWSNYKKYHGDKAKCHVRH